jgi:hypothetical protein
MQMHRSYIDRQREWRDIDQTEWYGLIRDIRRDWTVDGKGEVIWLQVE